MQCFIRITACNFKTDHINRQTTHGAVISKRLIKEKAGSDDGGGSG
jgi:hypothetical protein